MCSKVHGLQVSLFLHSSHLHRSVQLTPDWKHSQYFFWQKDFLQLQPLKCLFSLSPTANTPKLEGFVETLRSTSLYSWMLILSSLISFLKREFSSREVSIFGLKAKGFLMRICSLACKRSSSCEATLLQPLQAQLAPQNLLFAKHSQYNFKHLDFLQLQDLVDTSGTTDKD